jgi:hypothetical protein
MALPYLGPVAALFGLAPLPRGEVATILAATALYLVVLHVVKVWFFRTLARASGTGQAGTAARAAPAASQHL